MMHTTRTNLSVLDSKIFKIFLEANDMQRVNVGHYTERVNNFQTDNRICYAYTDTDSDIIASMTYMKLKYGSVEQAFVEYKKDIMTQSMSYPY